MSDIKSICRVCGHGGQSCSAVENAVKEVKGSFVAQCDAFALADDLKPGTVWRKEGPGDWIRIEAIQDPALPETYDGGLPGVSVTQFPFQNHGIQLRGGKRFFIAGADWPEQVRRNRFVLAQGWKRGDSISIADIISVQSKMEPDTRKDVGIVTETAIKETPIIQLYSPVRWHGSAAIVVNEAGKRLLNDLLNGKGEINISEAFVSDGEGFTLGVIQVGAEKDDKDGWKEANKYRIPYTEECAQGGEEGKIDPRDVIDEKEALDKAEFDRERDMSGA